MSWQAMLVWNTREVSPRSKRITQMHDEEGHTVRIRVKINQADLKEPRPGTTVRGKILCGRRPIGYTWFHEAIEWVQANVLF